MSAYGWRLFEKLAASQAQQPALIQAERFTRYDELAEMAERCAGALAVSAGDRVLISGPDSVFLAAAILACWRLGAIPALLHPDAPARHFEHARRTITPARELIGQEALAALAESGVHPSDAAPHQSPDAPASILFTSGSTGLPKAVTQSAGNLASGVQRVKGYLGYHVQDRILCGVPVSFDYGWGQLLSCLLGGMTLILPERPGGIALCQAIEQHRPTVLAAVPSLLADLLMGLAPIATTDCSSVRLITNTGSKIAPAIFELMLETFPGAEISLNYGLTETYRSASLPFGQALSQRSSVGYAIPGVDLVVVLPDGREAPVGEEGEIIHRGAGIFLGYWGDPEASAKTLRPDPFWGGTEAASGLPAPRVVYTGDLGHKDAEGRLFIHGRRDGQLKSMGVRVSRDEIETLIGQNGHVAGVAVVARPHPAIGDLIVACIEWKSDVDEKAALKALKQEMRLKASRFMEPREWRTFERLPRTTSGKVDYPTLRTLIKVDDDYAK